ncbi:MAG: hypothetical protein JWP29_3329, partial [Rhodoferax sp.]|nr:hypothetical protein [Rhodoferax sp.]
VSEINTRPAFSIHTVLKHMYYPGGAGAGRPHTVRLRASGGFFAK